MIDTLGGGDDHGGAGGDDVSAGVDAWFGESTPEGDPDESGGGEEEVDDGSSVSSIAETYVSLKFSDGGADGIRIRGPREPGD